MLFYTKKLMHFLLILEFLFFGWKLELFSLVIKVKWGKKTMRNERVVIKLTKHFLVIFSYLNRRKSGLANLASNRAAACFRCRPSITHVIRWPVYTCIFQSWEKSSGCACKFEIDIKLK